MRGGRGRGEERRRWRGGEKMKGYGPPISERVRHLSQTEGQEALLSVCDVCVRVCVYVCVCERAGERERETIKCLRTVCLNVCMMAKHTSIFTYFF